MDDETRGYAELNIALTGTPQSSPNAYDAELWFTNPDSDSEVPSRSARVELDLADLLARESDSDSYGSALAAALFRPPELIDFYRRVSTSVPVLRVRLRIAAASRELHGIRWELLRDPDTNVRLGTSECMPFSRFLETTDLRNTNRFPGPR